MTMISFPDVALRNVRWSLQQPAQVNRSSWTGRRQVIGLSGGGRWSASGEFVTRVQQANSYELRAFLAALRGPLNTFALPAYEEVQRSDMAYLASRASITNVANTTVAPGFRAVTKTGGTADWDASARSASSTTSGAVLQFRAGQTNGSMVAGINEDPLTDNNYTSIDYAFFMNDDGTFQCVESGASTAVLGTYTIEDVFAIVYEGTGVTYYKNGELVRSITTTSGRTFFFDSSLYTAGATIKDLIFCLLPSIAAGSRSFPVAGMGTSSMVAGWLGTALFKGGGSQLVAVTKTTAPDGVGVAIAHVEPPLRGAPYAFIIDKPFCEMALTSDTAGWSVDAGQQYSFSFDAEEAF